MSGVHLFDGEAVAEVRYGYPGGYVAVCGQLVRPCSSSGEGDDPAYCTPCVDAAARWNATRAGDREEAPGRFGQPGRYFVGRYGHPVRMGPDHRVRECWVCDPSRPIVPDLGLPATELYSINMMASVDTVSWQCRLCDHEAAVTSAPAADTDAVEHLAAKHCAVVAPT